MGEKRCDSVCDRDGAGVDGLRKQPASRTNSRRTGEYPDQCANGDGDGNRHPNSDFNTYTGADRYADGHPY